MIEDNDAGSLAHMAFKGFILICSSMMMVMDDDAWGTGTGTYGIKTLHKHLIKMMMVVMMMLMMILMLIMMMVMMVVMMDDDDDVWGCMEHWHRHWHWDPKGLKKLYKMMSQNCDNP